MKRIFAFPFLFLPVLAMAQETAAAAPPQDSGDGLMYLLVGAASVLLLAILVLGNVLIKLTELVIKKNAKAMLVLPMLLMSAWAMAEGTPAVPVAASAPTNWNYVVAGVVIGIELLVILLYSIQIRSRLRDLSDKPVATEAPVAELPRFLDNFNASVAIDKEHDILLDHNYDGIRELDNDLPPWWKYSFYISIVWAFCYIVYYFFGGPGQIDEYNKAVADAKVQMEEYARKNKDRVDENNVKLADAAGISEGADIFKANCVACHGSKGEGGVGPNLTDVYWLHGGSINEIFKSIKYGWTAKGMKAWETDLSAGQIRNVASFIHSLQGSNPPNGKAPQGEMMAAAGEAKGADSSVVAVADTTKK
ncbi:MAG: cbb3-type cytochrome c oxidase N-terminal domain-containing protein [Chitinophagales bacterium]